VSVRPKTIRVNGPLKDKDVEDFGTGLLHFFGYPNSLIPFNSKRGLLWPFNITGSNKTHSGYFCPIFIKFELSQQGIIKILSIKCHGIPSSGNPADTCGRTDTTKLISALRDYVNEP